MASQVEVSGGISIACGYEPVSEEISRKVWLGSGWDPGKVSEDGCEGCEPQILWNPVAKKS